MSLQNEISIRAQIKREFFEAIERGEKDVDYRPVSDYWQDRLCQFDDDGNFKGFKPVTQIVFVNGYGPNAETMTWAVKEIEHEELLDEAGEPILGEDGEPVEVFSIYLGHRIS